MRSRSTQKGTLRLAAYSRRSPVCVLLSCVCAAGVSVSVSVGVGVSVDVGRLFRGRRFLRCCGITVLQMQMIVHGSDKIYGC
jgi:hypothetical protein